MRFLKQLVTGIALVALAAFGLTGCGGGGGSKTNPAAAPVAPVGVTAVGGNAQVTINWQTVSGATSYNIYWGNASGVSKTSINKIAVPDASATSYIQTNLASGAKYYYIVTAVNGSGESVASSEFSATTAAQPAGPVDLSATPANNNVTLAWTAVAGATGYNIYRTISPGVSAVTSNKVATVNGQSTVTYLDNTATNGDTYYYKVTALVNGVETTPSFEMSAKPSANPAPAAPSGVAAVAYNMSGSEQVNVSWNKVTGATSYNIYMLTGPSAATASSTLVSGVTQVDNGTTMLARIYPTDTDTHYYAVTAVNANGESAVSAVVTAIFPIFTDEMVSGKTLHYLDDVSGDLTFNCTSSKTVSVTASTITGIPVGATGTWSTDGGTLSVTIQTDSYNYVIFNISGNGSILRVSFAKGSNAAQTGTLTIN